MRTVETILEAHSRLQESVINWGSLLIATGGALKPGKCSYYLISFKGKADGTWVYENNAIRPDLAIGVPLADSSLAEIEHLPEESAIKTLGSMTCPTGSSATALGHMQQQGQEWADRVKSGKLSHRNMWFMMDWHISLLGRIGSMPVESVLTARPQGRSTRDSSCPPPPIRQRILWNWMQLDARTRALNALSPTFPNSSYTMAVNQASEFRCKPS